MSEFESALFQEVGHLPPGPQSVSFDLHLKRRFEEFHHGQLSLDVELVPTLDEALPPVSSPEIDRAVRESLWVQFDTDLAGRRSAHVVVASDLRRHPVLEGVGLSLQADLLEAGKVRESVQLFRRFDPTEPGNYHAFYPLYQLPLATEKDIEARGPWTVRVIGTTKDILHLWTAKTRWNGRIELSIAELIARTRENNPESRPVWRLH